LVVAINNQAKQTRLGKHFPTSSFSWQWLAAGYCHLELSLGLLDSRGGFDNIRGGGDNSGDKLKGGSDHRGVVDHVVGHVLGHVLLDSDLGNVLNGVVDVVADVLDNGSGDSDGGGVGVGANSMGLRQRFEAVGGNSRGFRDHVGGSSRGGNNLGGDGAGDAVGVDGRGGGDNLGGGDRGGVVSGNRGSSDNRGLLDDRNDSLGDGVNKAVLVEVLRESLEGEGLVSLGCGDQVPQSGGEGAGGGALVDVGLDDLGVSSGGSQAGAHDGEEGDKLLHDDKTR